MPIKAAGRTVEGVARTVRTAGTAAKDAGEIVTPTNGETAESAAAEELTSASTRFAGEGARVTANAPREVVRGARRVKSAISDTKRRFAAARQAERGAKSAVKTANRAGERAAKAAGQTVKAAKTAAKTADKAVKTTQKVTKTTAKAAKTGSGVVISAVKAVARGVAAVGKALVAALKTVVSAAAAAGGPALIALIVAVAIIGGVAAWATVTKPQIYSGSASGTDTVTLPAVLRELIAEFNGKIQSIKNETLYDTLDESVPEPELLLPSALLLAKISPDPENPRDLENLTSDDREMAREIFFSVNTIIGNVETVEHKHIEESRDEYGNTVQKEVTETERVLHITADITPADAVAANYGFTEAQKTLLTELLSDEYAAMWDNVLADVQEGE